LPFFSNQNTVGVGLYGARLARERIGGAITVVSRPGMEALARIEVPVVSA
jgi:signal transduction histidine kinase